jgi:hypothetical protein
MMEIFGLSDLSPHDLDHVIIVELVVKSICLFC